MKNRCKYFEICEQSNNTKKYSFCKDCFDYKEQIKAFLKLKIDLSWYKNVKIDYDVNGKFIDVDFINNDLIIYHEEEGRRFKTVIVYWQEYEPKQLYYIWAEEDWQEVA
jgi:hypothetical protein